MQPSGFTIRVAHPSELASASAIDAAASTLYAAAGLHFELPDDHPFASAELARWRVAAMKGGVFWAMLCDEPVGFAVLGSVDGRAYLDQLAVRPEDGRRGVGRALLEHACSECRRRGEPELLLTTYDHVPWNGPFYARMRFVIIPESQYTPELRATLDAQRRVLPDPAHRVAMLLRL